MMTHTYTFINFLVLFINIATSTNNPLDKDINKKTLNGKENTKFSIISLSKKEEKEEENLDIAIEIEKKEEKNINAIKQFMPNLEFMSIKEMENFNLGINKLNEEEEEDIYSTFKCKPNVLLSEQKNNAKCKSSYASILEIETLISEIQNDMNAQCQPSSWNIIEKIESPTFTINPYPSYMANNEKVEEEKSNIAIEIEKKEEEEKEEEILNIGMDEIQEEDINNTTWVNLEAEMAKDWKKSSKNM